MSKSGHPPVYVWACCEGWQRFGPFDWVALTEDGQSFVNQLGIKVLIYDAHCTGWRSPKNPALVYRTPMVTSQFKHPKSQSGDLPFDRGVSDL